MTTNLLPFLVVVVFALPCLGLPVYAQQPSDAVASSPSQIEQPAAESMADDDEELEVDLPIPRRRMKIEYQSYGRRDPFRSLLEGIKSEKRMPKSIKDMSITEISLKGIMKSERSYVAMFEGIDGITYLLRIGSKVFDGTVLDVNAERVTFERIIYGPFGRPVGREEVVIRLHQS